MDTTSSPPGDRRTRNRERTHRALVAAALELFGAYGFAGVPVERIAERADVAPRTFFRYFRTKEDVVFADYEAEFDVWAEVTRDVHPGESLLDVIRRGTHRVAVDYEANRDHWDRWFALVSSEPALRGRWLEARALLHARATTALAGLLGLDAEADPRPAALAAAAMTSTDVAMRAWYASGRSRPRGEVVDEALDGLLDLGELLTAPVRCGTGPPGASA